MLIAQSQGTHAAEVIDRTEVVELGQRPKTWVFLAALCMPSGDDTAAPSIRLGVSQRKKEQRVLLGRRLARLVQRREREVR
jgi:hypothetical protein